MDVRITRWDLLRIDVGVMSRWHGAWLAWLGAVVAACLLQAWASEVSGSVRGWLVMGSAVLLTTAIASAAGCLVALGVMLFSTDDARMLGEHQYTFRDEGLRDQAGGGDTLIRWGGVRDVRRCADFILIHVAQGLYHALPRRSFGSQGEYHAFWNTAQRLRERQGREAAPAAERPSAQGLGPDGHSLDPS